MKYHRVPPSTTSISLKGWERICDKTESDDGCEGNRRKRWNNKLKRVFFGGILKISTDRKQLGPKGIAIKDNLKIYKYKQKAEVIHISRQLGV